MCKTVAIAGTNSRVLVSNHTSGGLYVGSKCSFDGTLTNEEASWIDPTPSSFCPGSDKFGRCGITDISESSGEVKTGPLPEFPARRRYAIE